MNSCEHMKEQIVAYATGNLPPDEAAYVEGHLVSCESCREEFSEVRDSLEVIQKEIPLEEPPANLRLQLREKLKKRSARQSKRRSKRLARQGRWRSLAGRRFYGLSLALHATAILLLIFVTLQVTFREAAKAPSQPVRPELDPGQALLGLRGRAPSATAGLTGTGAVRISTLRDAEAAYLVADPETGCVWAYLIGGRGNFSEESFRKRIRPENAQYYTRVNIENGFLPIPAKMRSGPLAGSRELVLVDLTQAPTLERLEIWPKHGFDNYINRLPTTGPHAGA